MHIDYVETFYQKKLAYASGPLLDENGNKKGGLLVSRMTLSEAKDFIKNDPFFIEDIADFEIKNFTPSNSSTSINQDWCLQNPS